MPWLPNVVVVRPNDRVKVAYLYPHVSMDGYEHVVPLIVLLLRINVLFVSFVVGTWRGRRSRSTPRVIWIISLTYGWRTSPCDVTRPFPKDSSPNDDTRIRNLSSLLFLLVISSGSVCSSGSQQAGAATHWPLLPRTTCCCVQHTVKLSGAEFHCICEILKPARTIGRNLWTRTRHSHAPTKDISWRKWASRGD